MGDGGGESIQFYGGIDEVSGDEVGDDEVGNDDDEWDGHDV